MRKKTVALVGSDCFLGRCLDNIKHNVISYEMKDIDWNKPDKAKAVINKGNPDAYVICYSAYDGAEVRLVEILRTTIKAALPSKAKIIGFVTEAIFDQHVGLIDETILPFSSTESGQLQILFEEKLMKYSNAVSFRVSNVWHLGQGFVTSFVKRMFTEEGITVERERVFSLTSSELLNRAVTGAIENDNVLYFNLADKGSIRIRNFVNFLQQNINGIKKTSRIKYVDGGLNLVLDSTRWNTISMTEGNFWQTTLQREVQTIMRNVNGIEL